jgi:tRNA(Met) C34 N-acetyltransferase TmcA
MLTTTTATEARISEELVPHSSITTSPSSAASPVQTWFHMIKPPDHVSPEPFITTLTFDQKALVIKAGLGRGKTTALVSQINQHHYDSILILSARKSFAHTMYQRLFKECPSIRFKCYDSVGAEAIGHPFTICQCESLLDYVDLATA